MIGRAGRGLDRAVIELGRIAQTTEHDRARVDSGRCRHHQGAVALAGETAGGHRPGQGTPGGLVIIGTGPDQGAVLMHEDNQDFRGTGRRDKLDLHRFTPAGAVCPGLDYRQLGNRDRLSRTRDGVY